VYVLQKDKIDEWRPLALSGDVGKAMSIYYHYAMFEDNQVDAVLASCRSRAEWLLRLERVDEDLL